MARLLLAAHDAGGVNVIATLAAAWRTDERISISFAGTPAVCRDLLWRVPDVGVVPWAGALGDAVVADPLALDALLRDRVRRGDWDAVVCGTSAKGALERRLIVHAANLGIPSFSLCDMWWDYQARYRDGAGWAVPDHLLVVDERMALDCAAMGWPRRPVTTVVGNPFLDGVVSRRVRAPRSTGALRFLSEPASSYYPDVRVDEFLAARTVFDTLRAIDPSRRFVVRTHPTEPMEPWRRFASVAGAELDVLPYDECLEDTWRAVGLSSMMLLEMSLAGVPSASFRPAGSVLDYFCLPFEDFGVATLDADVIGHWLQAPPRAVPERPVPASSAVDRISSIILAATGSAGG